MLDRTSGSVTLPRPSAPNGPLPRGQLIIDGAPVPRARLARAVDAVTKALEDLGIGEGTAVSTPARTGLPVITAAVAAQRLGAVLVLGEDPLGEDGHAALRGTIRARVQGDPAGLEPSVVRVEFGEPESPLPYPGASIFWTSGSTGTPKAVLLSRFALDYQATASAERFEVSAADGWVVPIPLSHAYGFSIMQMWLRFGCTLHLLSTMHPNVVAKSVCEPGSSMLDGVPALYGVLLRIAERDPGLRARLSGLKLRGCGGDVLPETLRRRFTEAVGQPIHDGYGLTEAGPNVAVSAPSAHRAGTAGKALCGTELRIAPGSGELLVHGPGLMTGYVNDPAATAAAFTTDGWLRTGDRAELSADGFLRITGRLKEVIIVQGETFAPSSIEQVLLEHPDVAEAAVLGLPRGNARGDHVIAYVVPQTSADQAVLVPELTRLCRAELPVVMRPRTIETVTEFPRLASGKLDRAALRRKGGLCDD
ncbi:class I adenylate-forming enzyme family protein [Streptomyces sp. YGL11-2]|uniref:class I adenylate-forming enzyme family protein n=1 Tax=Streptomyces sp. YGL11-2 TaxID=3414028 RepID=UPI003CF7669C